MTASMRLATLSLGLFAITASAFGAVLEGINLFQGDPLENLSGITFDGKSFVLPGGKLLPRGLVQSLEFSNHDLKHDNASQGPESAMDGLSAEAKSCMETGIRMAQDFPGVPGVILIDDGHFLYRNDGTHVYRYHFAGLVMKEAAKRWGQVTLGFTEGRSRTRLVHAHAVSQDGAVTTLAPADMKVGSPSEEASFFNPTQKITSGLIPGVEVGSVVEYVYEYEAYNPEEPRLFSPGFYFQGSEPVVFSRMVVQVPENIKLNYTTRNFPDGMPTEPITETMDGTKTFTWVMQNMPPVTPEPMMSPEQDVVPGVEASIFTDDSEVYGLLRALQEARIKLTPQIQAKVDELVSGLNDVNRKIGRIYHWVQENTRYVSIKGSLSSGFSGHTAQETFENRYGDCTDKSILFCTMLKAIDVQAYPIIIMTNDAGQAVTEIPTMSGNHCITEVVANGKGFYLDSTSENYRYPYFRDDDHGVSACNAIRGDKKIIPVPPPQDNSRKSRLDMVLDKDGNVQVKTLNQYTGSIEAGVRGFWKQVREDNYKAMMSEYVNSISPGAMLEDFSLSNLHDLAVPLEMTMEYTLHNHAIRAKKLMYLRIPTLDREYREAALETRRYPIQYSSTEERILDADLRLPQGYSAKWLPEPLEITSPYLEYRAEYKERRGHVEFHETYRRLQRIVPAADYAAYRDALRSISEFSKKEIFLTEKG